jgi:acetyl-CoA synthetase
MTVSQVQDNYAALHQGFRWAVPEQFNMAEVCCRRWAAAPDADERTAIIAHQPDGTGPRYSFAQLQDAANRLSNVLTVLGVQRGDRVAIVLPQRFETAVAYMAVLQMGAVGDAAVDAVRPGGAGLPPAGQRGAVVAICDGQRRWRPSTAWPARRLPRRAARSVIGRSAKPARSEDLDFPRCRWGRSRAGVALRCRHPGGRSGRADLHQRHHRANRRGRSFRTGR